MPWGPTLIQSPVPPLFGHGAAGGGGGPGGGGGLIEVQCPPITVGDLTTDALFAFNQHLWFHIYQCHIINIARISKHGNWKAENRIETMRQDVVNPSSIGEVGNKSDWGGGCTGGAIWSLDA